MTGYRRDIVADQPDASLAALGACVEQCPDARRLRGGRFCDPFSLHSPHAVALVLLPLGMVAAETRLAYPH